MEKADGATVFREGFLSFAVDFVLNCIEWI